MRFLAVAVAALALAAPAFASEQHPTQGEIESELVCPTCHEPLDESTSAIAQQMKDEIRAGIARGETKSQIEDALVAQPGFGSQILGVPRTHGFDLLAWVLPFAGIGFGAAGLAWGAWYWSRRRAEDEPTADEPEPALDPELEARLDDELKHFDD